LQGSARPDPQPDLAIEQYFYHADILTGQNDRVFLGTGDGTIWHDWTGIAAKEAKPKFEAVCMWFSRDASEGEFRQGALRDLSAILIRYAATIHGARMNRNVRSPPGHWISLSTIKDLRSRSARRST
jgi:hypothetical protein